MGNGIGFYWIFKNPSFEGGIVRDPMFVVCCVINNTFELWSDLTIKTGIAGWLGVAGHVAAAIQFFFPIEINRIAGKKCRECRKILCFHMMPCCLHLPQLDEAGSMEKSSPACLLSLSIPGLTASTPREDEETLRRCCVLLCVHC